MTAAVKDMVERVGDRWILRDDHDRKSIIGYTQLPPHQSTQSNKDQALHLPQSLYNSAASPTVQKMVDHLLITFDEKAPQSIKGLRVFQLGLLWR